MWAIRDRGTRLRTEASARQARRLGKRGGAHPRKRLYKYNSTTNQCLQGDRACFSTKAFLHRVKTTKNGKLWNDGILRRSPETRRRVDYGPRHSLPSRADRREVLPAG